MVGVNQILHASVEFTANAKRILDDDFLQVFNWAATLLASGKLLLPNGGSFQTVRRKNVIHEIAVKVLNGCVGINVGCQELGMDWT